MPNGYDILWGLLVGGTAPAWLAVPKLRRKVLAALRGRMGPTAGGRDLSRPGVMLHAVSLGEMNATRAMVAQLAAARPDVRFVITATTDTGYARGAELYGANPAVTLVRYPLDFTRAITRLFDRLRPDVVVLMELEVWPNFVYQCHRRGVPILLVNGRLTPSSFAHYRKAGPLVSRMFRRLTAVCAQDPQYAERFIALGAPPARVSVTGTMKFDTAPVADRIAGDAELAAAVGLKPGEEPIWVCGSTGPGEEELVVAAYRRLQAQFPRLRLVIVPRHPQRFDEVEELLRASALNVVRRSEPPSPEDRAAMASYCTPPVVLGDTMGELRKFYSLATVVFVGRSLVDLGPRQHGSDMIEPAGLAKPIVVGPFTHNFTEPMNRLREAAAIRIAADAADLARHVGALLTNSGSAAEMGRRAQAVVRAEQGATSRHVEIILRHLPPVPDGRSDPASA